MPRVGLISDTHGLLRPEAIAFLRGSDFVHAGDIGNASVLKELQALAPLTVVRGNNDNGLWAEKIAVSGHSHRPSVEERDGVLYVNPGSSGPRRFKLPIAVGELEVAGRQITETGDD